MSAIKDILLKVIQGGEYLGIDLGNELMNLLSRDKDVIRQAIVDKIFEGNNRALVGAILDKLEDGKIDKAEGRELLRLWVEKRYDDQEKLYAWAKGLENGTITRDDIIEGLITWVDNRTDNKAISDILNKIQNGGDTDDQIRKYLEEMATKWLSEKICDKEVAEKIVDALKEKKGISKDEALDILITWIKNETKDETIKEILEKIITIINSSDIKASAIEVIAKTLIDDGIDETIARKAAAVVVSGDVETEPIIASDDELREKILEALKKFLVKKGLSEELAAAVAEAAKDGRLNVSEIFQFLLIWIVAIGKERLPSLIEKVSDVDTDNAMEIISTWLKDWLKEDIDEFLKRVDEGKWQDVLMMALGSLDLRLGMELLFESVDDRIIDKLKHKFVDYLKKKEIEQPVLVAETLFDLISGKRKLVQDSPRKPPVSILTNKELLNDWEGCKECIFWAHMLTWGGDTVSKDRDSTPITISMSKIEWGTPIAEIIPRNASNNEIDLFFKATKDCLNLRFENAERRPINLQFWTVKKFNENKKYLASDAYIAVISRRIIDKEKT